LQDIATLTASREVALSTFGVLRAVGTIQATQIEDAATLPLEGH
jgi:hypothetical protein